MANRKQEELVIIVKTYDLMKWCCDHTSKFPRNYRFVLGERIERNLFEILESEAPVAAQSQLPWHRARGGCKAAGKADV
ncbi:MAG: four helix bundle protein [Pirellula sp.]|nr:four helix bundle protein [Pirellula sp.]